MSRPASPQPTSSADVVEMAALPSSSPRSSSLQPDSRSSSAEISHEAGEEEQKALLPYPAILQRRALAQELYRRCGSARTHSSSSRDRTRAPTLATGRQRPAGQRQRNAAKSVTADTRSASCAGRLVTAPARGRWHTPRKPKQLQLWAARYLCRLQRHLCSSMIQKITGSSSGLGLCSTDSCSGRWSTRSHLRSG